jgi:uncharacterized protein (TIGR03382 family)
VNDDQLDQLREAFLRAPESGATQSVAIAGAVALAALVLWLVRRRKLREEYTPIWIAVSLAIVAISFELDILRAITRAIGAWTPSSTLFFLGEVFLVGICLNFAVRLSRMSVQIKLLAQEVALLRSELERQEARQR